LLPLLPLLFALPKVGSPETWSTRPEMEKAARRVASIGLANWLAIGDVIEPGIGLAMGPLKEPPEPPLIIPPPPIPPPYPPPLPPVGLACACL